MAAFGDQEWDLEAMSLRGIFQRFEAVRLREKRRAEDHAVLLSGLWNTALMVRAASLRKKDRLRPRIPSDFLKGSSGGVDREGFEARRAERYDRRLKGLLARGPQHAVRYLKSRPEGLERRLLREAAGRYTPKTTTDRHILNLLIEN